MLTLSLQCGKLSDGVSMLVTTAMYRRADGVVTREIAGETLLIPITQAGVNLQKVYLLNETAAAIWGLLTSPDDVSGLVSALQERYEATDEVIRAGVVATLAELMERGFVLAVGGDG
jgi:hypothetical protein